MGLGTRNKYLNCDRFLLLTFYYSTYIECCTLALIRIVDHCTVQLIIVENVNKKPRIYCTAVKVA
jgi:hypothetical protein